MTTTATTGGPAKHDERQSIFVTTHWSVVLSARHEASPQSTEALEALCRGYWYPLYAHARWLGYNPQDAEDMTQEFFLRLLEKKYLNAVEPERGRFRTFILVVFKRFLSEQWRRSRAQKRGGGQRSISIDTEMAERLYNAEASSALPGDALFEQRWAMTLLEKSMNRLRDEFQADGKAKDFDRLKGFLTVAPDSPASQAANGALRVAVYRLRKRFRQILREEIGHTVAQPGDVTGELRYLLDVLSR